MKDNCSRTPRANVEMFTVATCRPAEELLLAEGGPRTSDSPHKLIFQLTQKSGPHTRTRGVKPTMVIVACGHAK